MLFWIRHSLSRQLAFLLAVTAVGAAGMYFSAYTPLLRCSPRMITLGILAGTFAFILLIPFVLAGLAFPKTGLRESLAASRAALLGSSIAARAGASITTAAGEEYLLRGLLFGSLARTHLLWAYALNAVAAAAANFRGRRHWYWTMLRVVEACWYAVLYDQHSSLTLLAAARIVQQSLATAALLSGYSARLLEQPRFSWRHLYEQARAPRRIIRRV